MTEQGQPEIDDASEELWLVASGLLAQAPDLERFPPDKITIPPRFIETQEVIIANFFQQGPTADLPPDQIPTLENWREALQYMLKANSNNARLWMILGQSFIEGQERAPQGEFDEIFQLVAKGKEKVDDAREGYRRASKCWERAIEIDPNQPVLLLRLGQAYVQVSGTETNWKKAMMCWGKSVEMRPSLTPAWFNMGSRHEFTYDWDRARECYSEALKHNPKHVPTLIKYGYLSGHLGNRDDANNMLRRAALLDPDYNKRPEYLASIAFHRGQGF